MSLKVIAISIFVFCTAAATIWASESGKKTASGKKAAPVAAVVSPREEPLTVRQAIQMALENNLDARIERLNVNIAQGRILNSAGAFDPILTLSASRESTEVPQNSENVSTASQIQQQLQSQAFANAFGQAVSSAFGTAAGPAAASEFTTVFNQIFNPTTSNQLFVFENEAIRAGADLKGKLPTGTTYELTLNGARIDHSIVDFPQQQFVPDNVAFAGITLDQPLLRDFGTDVNLAELRINRKNKKISQLTWTQKVIDVIQNVIGTYSDMFYAQQIVRAKEEAVAANHKLVQANQRRLELGLMAPIEVTQAQVGESIAQEDLVSARQIFLEKQYALRRLIMRQAEVNDQRVFTPAGGAHISMPVLDRMVLMREAYTNRVEYKSALHAAEIEDIRLRFAKNQLLPKIDLVGTYGLNGLANGIGKSFDNAFSGQAAQWSIGVVATIPIGNRQARAQLYVAKNLKEQAILRIQQTELDISLDVDTALSRIRSRQQSVETAAQSRRLAEEAVRIEERRLEEGQGSSFDVVETQRKLYDARSREIAARADLDKAIVQLWVATGVLLEKESIKLAE